MAYDTRDSGLTSLLLDPLVAKLHDESRWEPLLDKMDLPHKRKVTIVFGVCDFHRPCAGRLNPQAKLNWIAGELNERPRKTLEYKTPTDRFNAYVSSTS